MELELVPTRYDRHR